MLKNDAKTAQSSSKDHKTARTRAKTTLKEQNMLFVPLDRHQRAVWRKSLQNFAKLTGLAARENLNVKTVNQPSRAYFASVLGTKSWNAQKRPPGCQNHEYKQCSHHPGPQNNTPHGDDLIYTGFFNVAQVGQKKG